MQTPFAQLEMARPAWLLAILLVPLVVYWSRRSLAGFSRGRQGVSLACRILVIVAVILALCGIGVVRQTDETFVVAAVDRSESIAEDSRRRADAFVDELRRALGPHRVAVVQFARYPAIARDERPGAGSDLDPQGTNLAAAIELARAAVPADCVPRLVLLTDGIQTEGDALSAARAARVPISTVPLASRAGPEVYVSDLKAPVHIREDERFSVEVLLHASGADEGRVKLFCDDRLVDETRAKVSPGQNRVRFTQSIAGERLARYTARIDGFRDTFPENNAASAVVLTTPRPRVLLVDREPLLAGRLAAAFQSEGLEVDVHPPDAVPRSPAGLERYDLVVLSNVPAASLDPPQMDSLRGYVGDLGGGLIVVGGDQAFTPGGYHGTTLEEILPVSCELEKSDERPRLAMVLVIDRSGSMEEGGAIELAKEATSRAVDLLRPKDQVGVIAYQDYPEWISPLHSCSDKQAVLDRIGTITAGGGTNMYPAMERAYLALRESTAELKHVLVLTDGVSHADDFDGLATRMAESGITVSTVAVGPEAVRPLLEGIARIGNGHHYDCDTAASVPEVFALETATVSRMGIIERPFRARVQQPLDALAGVDLEAAPSLLGCAETQPKPAGQVVMTAEQGRPLLAWWPYGRGKTVAFTSDVQPRWAAAWLRWPGFDSFWGRLARFAIRRAPAEDLVPGADQKGRRGLAAGYPDEYRTRPTDHALLQVIAQSTGGTCDAAPAVAAAPSGETVPRTTLLWPFFLAAAAMIYVVDVAVRRWPPGAESETGSSRAFRLQVRSA